MKLLALDTATEALSVALYVDGEISTRESRPVRGHGAALLPMVEAVLSEAGLTLGALDALAVGRGPGAFTGVRIAVSVAQGLGLAVGLPIVPVSDLAALAWQAAGRAALAAPLPVPLSVLACLDARLGALYAGLVRLGPGCANATDEAHYLEVAESLVTAEALDLPGAEPLLVAGHGWTAAPGLGARFGGRLLAAYPELLPSAAAIARLAVCRIGLAGLAGAGVGAEALAPTYLRDEVATRSSRAPGAPR